MEDTWTNRDLPTLQAVVKLCDQRPGVRRSQICEETNLTEHETNLALRALDQEQPPFFTKTTRAMGGEYLVIGGVTGHARRAVGAWPTPETLVDRLIAELAKAAENEPDPEKKTKLQAIGQFLTSAGRDIAVGVASSVLGSQIV